MSSSRVLIIQLTRFGDVIQTLPVLNLLRKEKSSTEVFFFGIRSFCGFLGELKLVDHICFLPEEIYPLVAGGWKPGIEDFLLKLLENPFFNHDFDQVINLTHSKISAFLCDKIKATHKSGRIFGIPGETRLKGGWAKYFFSNTHVRKKNLLNLVDIYIGMTGLSRDLNQCGLRLTGDHKEKGRILLVNNGYQGKRLVGVHLGANQSRRQWPVIFFQQLVSRIAFEADAEVVLLGGEREMGMGKEVSNAVNANVINLCGKTGFWELASVLSFCEFFLSGDTGPMHLAAALQIPVLALFFSSAFFGETAPYAENVFVIQSELKCCPCEQGCENMKCKFEITPEIVFPVVRKILSKEKIVSEDSKNFGPNVLYQSSFCSKGFLIFKPVSSVFNSEHAERIANRLVWDGCNGFSLDDSLLCFLKNPQFESDLKEFFRNMNQLICQYKTVLNKLDVCSSLSLCRAIIEEMEKYVFKSPDTWMKYYHQYELMDMDVCEGEELLMQIRRKYEYLYYFFDKGMKLVSVELNKPDVKIRNSGE